MKKRHFFIILMVYFTLLLPPGECHGTFINTILGKIKGGQEADSSPSSSARSTDFDSTQTVEVAEIKFIGNKSFNSSKLKDLMDLKAKSLLHPFKQVPFDRQKLEEDIRRLERFYQSEGYYDATISRFDVEKVSPRMVTVTIHIEEGEPVIVQKVTLKLTDVDNPNLERDITLLLPLKEGKVFRTESYKACEKAVLRYLAEEGYPRGKIETIARVFKKEKKAFAWIDVTLGPLCKFGPVTINGLSYVNEREVLRFLTFKEGEVFKASKIRESQKKLFDSQLFSFADINIDRESESPDVPIKITIREAKPYTLKAGLGYGTEDKIRGKLELEARRFLGDARKLKIQAKGSFITQQLETQFIQPHFLTESQWLESIVGLSHDDKKSFEVETLYLTPQINTPISNTWRFFAGPNIESNKISNLEIVTEDDIEYRKKSNYFISSLIFGFVKEDVDDPLNPQKGFRIFNTNEWASETLESEVSYIKTDWEVRTYLPIYNKVILANRFRWGMISNIENSSNNVPIFKKFFSGGSNSVRGYGYNKLGPLDQNGNPLGGKSVVEINNDLRFPIFKNLEGVLFFDFGTLSLQETDFSLSDLKYATGIGLRYQTIVGPLRLDIGYALNPPEKDSSTPLQLYFSIGQAF